MSFTSEEAIPSTFILNGDVVPPPSFIEDIFSFWSLLLKILKVCVTDPTEVKTVSNDKVSLLVDKFASALVIKVSFRQETRINIDRKMRSENFN